MTDGVCQMLQFDWFICITRVIIITGSGIISDLTVEPRVNVKGEIYDVLGHLTLGPSK